MTPLAGLRLIVGFLGRRSARRALLVALVVTLGAPAGAAPEGAPPDSDAASFAHPLAGTETGGAFPGADTPFGMVQYSPNTDDPKGGGYRHSSRSSWGFATTHLSGPGCPAMGDVVSLPTIGTVRSVDAARQKTRLWHATEQASPGYYAVDLGTPHIHAELSATTRTGWARFTYPATSSANVIVDPGANYRGAQAASVRVVGDRTVEGSVRSWGYWNACPARGRNRYTVHFSMRFDRPFAHFGTGNGSRVRRGRRTARGADAGAYVSFDSAADPRPLVSEVAISYVDATGARRNLASEAGGGGGFDFDAVRARARTAWDELLGRVQVSGGSDEQRDTFYSALYHTLLHPNVFSDDDGRYEGFDDRVHRLPAGQAHYTSFSMWDTSRSAHQAIDLVAPERVADMMRSLLDDQRQAGWLPKWPFAHYETNEMVGDPAASVLADALLKGLMRSADVAPAYSALLHNASEVPARSPFEGRTGLDDYLNRGFVPYRGDGDHPNAGSIDMEYALNDCALALTAQRLGRDADWRYLLRRAKRYRRTIDRSSGLARPRLGNGSFLSPFRARSSAGFKEGSGAQYTWLAPQDVSGLAAALGGRGAALARLDRFFDYGRIAANPASARRAWRGPARYNPRNETDLQAPYLYDYLGQPWKTQAVVRAAETLFSSAPNGLPGSDDLGAMSSWYVMSALGLFPSAPGDDHYALTSPLFDRVVVAPPSAFYPGGPLVIEAPGASAGLSYVSGVSLGGEQLPSSAVSHADLTRGHRLQFALAAAPGYGWATGAATPVSACADNPPSADVRVHVSRGRSSRGTASIRATLRNAGDAPAGGLLVTLHVPRGWAARLSSSRPSALAGGHSATLTWRLRARRGQRAGGVRADVRWSSAGASGGALRTFGTATVRLGRR